MAAIVLYISNCEPRIEKAVCLNQKIIRQTRNNLFKFWFLFFSVCLSVSRYILFKANITGFKNLYLNISDTTFLLLFINHHRPIIISITMAQYLSLSVCISNHPTDSHVTLLDLREEWSTNSFFLAICQCFG